MLRYIVEKLERFSRRFLPATLRIADTPLMDDRGLRELALYAESLPWPLLAFRRPASHPLIGERLSSYRGRGLEFEENKAYQAGDEPRLLNWRLYARAGELYTKVFTEERRPQVFVLLDRRSAMRFATRGQLKVALAAQIAACYAYQAHDQALAVGGLILNQSMEWFEPATGDVALNSFVRSLVAPCPPLPFDHEQRGLDQGLRLLLNRLPGGSFVLMLSDFADLDPDAAMPLLHRLATQHSVRAIQILDPVELSLPSHGDFLIEDGVARPPLRIDGQDSLQQAQYRQAFNECQSQLADCFRRSGIPFETCATDGDLETCLGKSDAGRFD